MEPNYWIKKWETNDIRSHRLNINQHLIRHENVILPSTVFVPLCGKTLDMDWLCKRGHSVIGAELSEIACRDFFQENKRVYRLEKRTEFALYRGEGITLWCGDFFKLPADVLAGVTSVFDRAALVALPAKMRLAYAEYLKHLLKAASPHSQMLLVSIEYDADIEAPPHSVSEKEVRSLYSDAFDITLLGREVNEMKITQPKFKGVDVYDAVYCLKSRRLRASPTSEASP